MLKAGLYRTVYDFGIDYKNIPVDDILDIHEYLMEKNNIKWCLYLLKNVFFTAMTFFSYNVN